VVKVVLVQQERNEIMESFLKAVVAVIAGVWIYDKFVKKSDAPAPKKSDD
jgi:hypothetical protein